jgi:glucokinase
MKENDFNVNLKAHLAARMILSGDIGGTKTLIGLFDSDTARPRRLAVRAYPTLQYSNLSSMVAAFLQEVSTDGRQVEAACFGVAGPVIGTAAQLTNVPWRVDAVKFSSDFQIRQVTLLNDLQAAAYAVHVLSDDELHVLQEGQADAAGHLALIAAGTGLGEAFIHNVGGHFIPSPSEGGHADWAARSEREIDVLRALLRRFGRAEVEHVVSGQGLANLHRVTHSSECQVVPDPDDVEAPAAISTAALEHRCQGCIEALTIFVGAFGAEAGNLALRTLATAGVFVGGGIAPKILPALTDGRFMRAFRDKAPFDAFLTRVPVRTILNPEAGLIGAALRARAEIING